MLAAVPAVAAATYLRYGAPLPMAIGLLGVAVWRRRALLRRPVPVIADRPGGGCGSGHGALRARPHRGASSPLGAIAGFDRSWPSGFADYAGLAHEVVGPAVVVLALAGVVAAFGWVGTAGIDRGALVASLAIGLATAVAIAAVLHGEVRYLAPAYPWLWIAGAPGLERAVGVLPGRVRPTVAAMVALALVAGAIGLGARTEPGGLGASTPRCGRRPGSWRRRPPAGPAWW